ncbi:hypothetical protein SDC9_57893 [bioreactor metagenome]|uniref:DUF6998 domain-containing protein n=1 Tax=bioreactor metagenome TaxID=1076179 RepID=A0A644X6I1_9ZZZZ
MSEYTIGSMVSEQIRAIYKISNELENMFPGRHFTPDGHMVGSWRGFSC